LTDKVGLRLWSLVSKFIEPPAGIPNDDQWRVRLDLNMKF
jgi:hypothetical protein